MVNFIADSSDINRRLREIRKEEGRRDTDWKTAVDEDLTVIAHSLGLARGNDGDYSLRARIEDKLRKASWT
jgi:hypothetical protein